MPALNGGLIHLSQIMTSKSPVRSCEDVDETTLSFAEIKALCAGDPRIKEKMNLDVEVSKLRLLKSSFQSQKYTLEDNLARYFPREIAETKARIAALESDIGMRDTHPVPVDGFVGIELDGVRYTERIAAGEALLNLLPTVQDTRPVHVGSFRGFEVEVSLEQFGKYGLTLKGAAEHRIAMTRAMNADPKTAMASRFAMKAWADNKFSRKRSRRLGGSPAAHDSTDAAELRQLRQKQLL